MVTVIILMVLALKSAESPVINHNPNFCSYTTCLIKHKHIYVLSVAVNCLDITQIRELGATSVMILMNRDQPYSKLDCKYSLFFKIYHNYITKSFTVMEPTILFEP